MRLLLDAHLSPRRIGALLAADGHDVLCLSTDAALGALDDPEVIELAAEQGRLLVTRNSRDFAPLLREWAEAGRHHSGCILVRTLRHDEFGKIANRLGRLLADRPEAPEWIDLVVAV